MIYLTDASRLLDRVGSCADNLVLKSVNDQRCGAQPSIAAALNARGLQAHACGPSQALAQRGNRAIAYLEMSVASGTFTFWGRLKLTEAAPDCPKFALDPSFHCINLVSIA